MRRLVLVALVALLALACGSAPSGQAHTIALAFKPGDSYKYKAHAAISFSISEQGQSMQIALDVTGTAAITVKSVDSSGTADLSITISDLTTKTSYSGITNTQSGTPSTTIDVKVDSDGRIVGINGGGLGMPSSGFPIALPSPSTSQTMPGGLVTALLPDGSVKPGDKWSKDYNLPNPDGTGSIQISTKSTYLADEQVAGVTAAKVETKTSVNANLTIDLGSILGTMLQSSSSLTLPATSGGTTPPFPVPSPGIADMLQSITLQGTNSTDVTTWFDASKHRIVKSHSTGTTNGTVTVSGGSTGGSTTPGLGLTGPVTVTGTELIDINPA